MGIRVLEANYKPGDSSALHSHPDYALYVINGGTAEFTGKDGKKMVNEMKSGMENIRAEEVHSVKNTGKTTIKVLLVEVNRPMGTIFPGCSNGCNESSSGSVQIKKRHIGNKDCGSHLQTRSIICVALTSRQCNLCD